MRELRRWLADMIRNIHLNAQVADTLDLMEIEWTRGVISAVWRMLDKEKHKQLRKWLSEIDARLRVERDERCGMFR